MISFVLIAICILVGYIFNYKKLLPPQSHKGINAWIIYVALPAVSLKYIPQINWNYTMLVPVIGPILVWIGAYVFVKIITYKRNLSKATIGALYLCAGLSNTSFVGFPLITAYFGEEQISIAVICDQVTFILLSTVGIAMAINHSDKHTLTTSLVIKKMASFPPLWGCFLAFILPHFMDLEPFMPLFDKLAGTVAPLALFSIGLQLKLSGLKNDWKPILSILGYKLILAPVLVLVLVYVLNIKGMPSNIAVFEAAMPTLLTASVVADEYHLNTKLVNIATGITILAAFITTLFWYLVLTY